MREDDWGPWIEHDGKGCPCEGTLVESTDRAGRTLRHIAKGWVSGGNGDYIDCWDWSLPQWKFADQGWQIIRYRIRRPRGLTILEALIADLPVPVPVREGVDA